ncbi:MAG: hypothetical protein R3B06_01265 [Kofleriaceae bacterium]
MARWLVSALVVTLLPLTAAAGPRRRHGSTWTAPDAVTDTVAVAAPHRAAFQADAPVRVFLNAAGGTLTAGEDDPARGRSWIARAGDGGRVEVPPYPRDRPAWDRVVACVRAHFAPFAVDVVDRRPTAGAYTMVMVGGAPALIGQPASVSGIAPASSGVLRGAVGYAFVDADDAPADTCGTIAHEVGHTLGLDHTLDCHDLMSYDACGPKAFTDRAAACGEYDARSCDSGEATQNAYQQLGAAVGWRRQPAAPTGSPDATDGAPADPWLGAATSGDDGYAGDDDTDIDEGTDEGIETDDAADEDEAPARAGAPAVDAPPTTATATLAFLPGPTRRRGDRWTGIDLRATASAGVAEVYLLWGTPDQAYAWACGDLPDDLPVTCTRAGDEVRFELMVGTGPRVMAAVLVDRAGRTVETEPFQLRFR